MGNFCQIETSKGIDRLKNAAGGAKALIVANPLNLPLRGRQRGGEGFKRALPRESGDHASLAGMPIK